MGGRWYIGFVLKYCRVDKVVMSRNLQNSALVVASRIVLYRDGNRGGLQVLMKLGKCIGGSNYSGSNYGTIWWWIINGAPIDERGYKATPRFYNHKGNWPISASIPVEVDGISFTITIFEETTGETIFSRGSDRTRVEFGHTPKEAEANTTSSARSKRPGIPCSPAGSLVSSPETRLHSSRWVNSKLPVCNDEGDCMMSTLGFCCHHETEIRDSDNCRTLGAFCVEYMSFSEKLRERVLMADSPSSLMRSEGSMTKVRGPDCLDHLESSFGKRKVDQMANLSNRAWGPNSVPDQSDVRPLSTQANKPKLGGIRLKCFAGWKPTHLGHKFKKTL
ncbi:hypothetical protein Ancab_016181 [Ancistrocladus abbreviatus]